MKHLKLLLLAILALFLFSSCSSVHLFSVNTLQGEYDASSVSKAKATKDIKVYYDEKDIPQPYKVVSVGAYKPFALPLISSVKKKTKKHLVEKAVSSAVYEGGNAVYIQTETHFKVLLVE